MYPSPYKRLTGFILCSSSFLLIFLSVVFISSASARTWYIKADGTGDAPTIQAGVDSAAVGDTVMVGPGSYSDTVGVQVNGWSMIANVHVSKSISIIGEDKEQSATLDGINSHISIFVEGSTTEATIKHLTMTRGYGSPGCIIGIGMRKSLQQFDTFGVFGQGGLLTIEDNSIRDIGTYGIYFESGNTIMVGNEFDGALYGVVCWSESQAIITANCLRRCVYPIIGGFSEMSIVDNLIEGGGRYDTCIGIGSTGCRALVSGNHIQDPKFRGIDCGGGDDVTIENNIITGPDEGLFLGGSDSTRVRGNIFYHCKWAINVLSASFALIESNTIDANGIGIVCQLGTSPIIRNNVVVRAGTGVSCDVGSSPLIECNDVFQVELPYVNCGDQTGLNGNISVDPEFCGIDDSGNYFLQSDSPCAPGNHPGGIECGLIGALSINCGTVKAERRSWGAVKNLFK